MKHEAESAWTTPLVGPLFLVERLPPDEDGADGLVVTGAEARHARAARRLMPGEPVSVGDGRGAVATGRVRAVGRDRLEVSVEARTRYVPAEPRLLVAQALLKGGRDEAAVAAMTEVGVDGVLPWAAGRCVVRWSGERGERSRRGWATAAREAAKQSLRPFVPDVPPVVELSGLVERVRVAALAVLLDPDGATPVGSIVVPGGGEVLVVVGPEGGISPVERQALVAAGALAVRMGPSVQRAGTAGAVACGVLLSRSARWG